MRRAKRAQIYKKTGNLRAVQLLLGHTRLESTVHYRGIEVDDALIMSGQVEL
jgi:site-specific recombinase XerC